MQLFARCAARQFQGCRSGARPSSLGAATAEPGAEKLCLDSVGAPITNPQDRVAIFGKGPSMGTSTLPLQCDCCRAGIVVVRALMPTPADCATQAGQPIWLAEAWGWEGEARGPSCHKPRVLRVENANGKHCVAASAVGVVSRSRQRIARTVLLCHAPPRAVRAPRSFSASRVRNE